MIISHRPSRAIGWRVSPQIRQLFLDPLERHGPISVFSTFRTPRYQLQLSWTKCCSNAWIWHVATQTAHCFICFMLMSVPQVFGLSSSLSKQWEIGCRILHHVTCMSNVFCPWWSLIWVKFVQDIARRISWQIVLDLARCVACLSGMFGFGMSSQLLCHYSDLLPLLRQLKRSMWHTSAPIHEQLCRAWSCPWGRLGQSRAPAGHWG